MRDPMENIKDLLLMVVLALAWFMFGMWAMFGSK